MNGRRWTERGRRTEAEATALWIPESDVGGALRVSTVSTY